MGCGPSQGHPSAPCVCPGPTPVRPERLVGYDPSHEDGPVAPRALPQGPRGRRGLTPTFCFQSDGSSVTDRGLQSRRSGRATCRPFWAPEGGRVVETPPLCVTVCWHSSVPVRPGVTSPVSPTGTEPYQSLRRVLLCNVVVALPPFCHRSGTVAPIVGGTGPTPRPPPLLRLPTGKLELLGYRKACRTPTHAEGIFFFIFATTHREWIVVMGLRPPRSS